MAPPLDVATALEARASSARARARRLRAELGSAGRSPSAHEAIAGRLDLAERRARRLSDRARRARRSWGPTPPGSP